MITSLHVFVDGFAKAVIKCPDGTIVEIQIPSEALGELSIDDRTRRIVDKARKYICTNCQSDEEIIRNPSYMIAGSAVNMDDYWKAEQEYMFGNDSIVK